MSNPISEKELLSLIHNMPWPGELLSAVAPGERPDGGECPQGLKIEQNHIGFAGDPDDLDTYSLEAVSPVRLLINGKLCTERAYVSREDRIDWEIEKSPLFRIEVSDNKQEAHFQLLSRVRYGWRLKEQEARRHLVVEAEQDEAVVVEAVGFTEIMKEIHARGIVKNLRASAIFQELQNPGYAPILIASGVEPEPSQDAQLELYFSEEIQNVFQENERTRTVDFRNHLHIPSARRGEVIAKKIPMRAGVIGYDVYGELIYPEPPKDITIIAKEFVEINANNEVIALKDGRPRLTGNDKIKYFDISPAFVVSGNVDLKTGHIVFSGDVIVYGDVLEGMIIESLGNVYIFGNVYQATITATGSITIKGNMIKSNLYSGYFGVIFNRLYVSCKALYEQLHQLTQAARTLEQLVEAKGQRVRIGQILTILTESKFKGIPQQAADALATIGQLQQHSAREFEELKERLHSLVRPSPFVALDSFNPILAIQHQVQETYQEIERMQEVTANIDVGQSHLSNLKATGNIYIRRDGVMQSHLYCKGNIVFFDKQAICRGGQLEALGMISAMAVGGERGVRTIVKAGKRIMLQRMTLGRLFIGKYWKEIDEPITNVTAYIQDQKLVIESDR